jgi:hypothetical protein
MLCTELNKSFGNAGIVEEVQTLTEKQNFNRFPPLDTQMQFLDLNGTVGERKVSSSVALEEAVLFSAQICGEDLTKAPPQFSLLGRYLSKDADDPRIMLNTNIPFSTFVCGVQGSGKSHTTSCIIGKFLTRCKGVYLSYYRELYATTSWSRCPEETSFSAGV